MVKRHGHPKARFLELRRPVWFDMTNRAHRPLLAAIVATCALAITACGSSGHTPSASSHADSFLAFSKCMRSHGVPNFPDPSGGGGIHISNLDTSSPAFQAAQATCNKRLPGGGPPAKVSEQQKQRMFATSECMRKHGVSGFPDPIAGTPPANPQGYSMFEGIGSGSNAIWLGVPSTIDVNSPAFKRAAKTCGFLR